jgi:hypothetical protein
MKKYINFLCIIFLLGFGCSKSDSGGGSSNQGPQEQPIAFTIDATNNSVSTSSNFTVNLTLTSTMPAAGIKIEITTTDQVSSAIVQNQTITSNSSKNLLLINNLVQQHWSNVTIKVISASNNNNSSTQTFTVVYK